MFLRDTTPTKQARNICLIKRGYRKIELYGYRRYVTLGNFVQLAMLFLAMLLSTWVDVVFNFLAAKF